MSRTIKRYNIETGELHLTTVGETPAPRPTAPTKPKSRVVHGVHSCNPPSAYKHGLGTVWQCGECGLFAKVYRYMPSKYAKRYKFAWKNVGFIKQRRYEKMYG